MSRYKITVKHSFGPFASTEAATAAKKNLRQRIPKMRVSGFTKSGKNYRFTGTIVYTKSIKAPATVVKAATQKVAPGATVTVTILR